MGNGDLWKYCDTAQCNSFLLSLKLLPGENSEAAQLARLYALSNHVEKHYHQVRIPKKSGGWRKLMVPDPLLKNVQRNILHHCLDGRSISPYATAYRRGASLRENAVPHVGGGERGVLLKIDIKDFFDSIVFPRVYAAAFPAELFPPAAATLLTNLCCCRDRLPQGAPTSPTISNLVMKPFDDSMGEWCRQRGIVYTRYCDDLTFSGDMDARAVYRKVRGFLEAMGFALNERKTKVQSAGQRQTVTGIVVNEKIQVSAEYRRKLRQEIYYCRKYGVEAHLERCGKLPGGAGSEAGEAAEYSCETVRSYMESILGRINYVLQINPQDQEFTEYKRIWMEVRTHGTERKTGTVLFCPVQGLCKETEEEK